MDTEIHGVKLNRGHLHFDNQTYSYYDPNSPGIQVVDENEATFREYFMAFGIFLICVGVIILFFSMLVRCWKSVMKGNMSMLSRDSTYTEQHDELSSRVHRNFDPALFYKDQHDENNGKTFTGSKRGLNDLNLQFEPEVCHSERREKEAQEQIKNLEF